MSSSNSIIVRTLSVFLNKTEDIFNLIPLIRLLYINSCVRARSSKFSACIYVCSPTGLHISLHTWPTLFTSVLYIHGNIGVKPFPTSFCCKTSLPFVLPLPSFDKICIHLLRCSVPRFAKFSASSFSCCFFFYCQKKPQCLF